MELRSGVTKLPGGASSLDMVRAIPTDAVFDLLAVRLNPEKAEGKAIAINWTFTDTDETFNLNLENSALTNVRGKLAARADAGFTLTRATLNSVLVRQTTFPNAIRSGDITFKGEPGKIGELFGMLDDVPTLFPIVEPVQAQR
jgi:alkyl sulfatase BDS1-like metallo-beta-lactamase superfamily hydrolase